MPALSILKECFRKEGQPLAEFATELRELKFSCTPEDYRSFVRECAAYLGVEPDFPNS